MSLYDELNGSFESEATLTTGHEDDRPILGSLASELESAMDESYESDSAVLSTEQRVHTIRKKRSSISRDSRQIHSDHLRARSNYSVPISEYSGDEWGDPADDSDPDGRFSSLDDAIENFLACLDLDSAYESQEEGREGATNSSAMNKNQDPTGSLIRRLQNIPSQSKVETSASKFITLHNTIVHSIQTQVSELRGIVQVVLPGHGSLESDSEEAVEVSSASIDELLRMLPSIDFVAFDELAILGEETDALIADLSLLSDSLQEIRQMTAIAQRSLRSTRDNVDQWKSEIVGVERASRWLESRSWEDKLSQRTTSKELIKIRSGFEAVCDDIRKQIEAC